MLSSPEQAYVKTPMPSDSGVRAQLCCGLVWPAQQPTLRLWTDRLVMHHTQVYEFEVEKAVQRQTDNVVILRITGSFGFHAAADVRVLSAVSMNDPTYVCFGANLLAFTVTLWAC